MKMANCRARGRILAFGLFADMGDRLRLPLAQAISLGASVVIESVDEAEELAPSGPAIAAAGRRGMEKGPTFDRQMHRATRSRLD